MTPPGEEKADGASDGMVESDGDWLGVMLGGGLLLGTGLVPGGMTVGTGVVPGGMTVGTGVVPGGMTVGSAVGRGVWASVDVGVGLGVALRVGAGVDAGTIKSGTGGRRGPLTSCDGFAVNF
jgi:hypothetical protein